MRASCRSPWMRTSCCMRLVPWSRKGLVSGTELDFVRLLECRCVDGDARSNVRPYNKGVFCSS
ncbi:hypothetical protein WOLCODRAFT_166125 [Wolfiporia cocos MD-104 SS10]|uniref:Uncharacterized protein n=1 Tax=Wolfiporia cocos (strain MD-104) TaxID=742152 RepID=A0A2H3JET1_WOLCO|nr:hypothetical protein WOLCODRAFT_166125 [Wolfiporia cocos MD-104 SS10]